MPIITLLSLLILILLAAALLLLRRARSLRTASGLPAGEVLYADTGVREELEKPLLSRRHGLVGRPDYLVRLSQGRASAAGVVIPVEVKSGHAPAAPYTGHILQLGAYCLLVEDAYQQRPPYGLLRYADTTFKIPFTDQLRYQVLEAAAAIRRARSAPDIARSHNDPARCAACGYRSACEERLV